MASPSVNPFLAVYETPDMSILINPYRFALDVITPLSPVMWLKADSLALSNGNPVATWTDSSGTGNNATQATSGSRPTFVASGIGGKPALLFDGVDDWLSVPLLYSAQYFAVFKSQVSTWDGYWGILDIATNNTSQRWGLMSDGQTYFHSDPFPRGVRKNGAALTSPFDCGTITSPMILAVEPEADALDNAPRGVGRMDAFFGNFMLAELIAFNSVQSAPNAAIVEQYLSAKYSIAI